MNADVEKKGPSEISRVVELLKRLQIHPSDAPTKQEPPEPDVSFALAPGKVVGVEVTGLQLDDKEVGRQQPELEKTLRLAKEQYYRSGGPALGVRIYSLFHPGMSGIRITKAFRQKRANDLVKLIQRYLPASGQVVEISASKDEKCELPEYVENIVLRAFDFLRDDWILSANALTPTLTVREVRATVDAKERKPDKYKHPYAEKWLLIHNGFGAEALAASRFLPNDIGTECEFSSSFDRLFLLSAGDGLTELRRKQATSSPDCRRGKPTGSGFVA